MYALLILAVLWVAGHALDCKRWTRDYAGLEPVGWWTVVSTVPGLVTEASVEIDYQDYLDGRD